MLHACFVHRFDLRKAQARQHIVEGLLKALTDLDKVVATVRAAKDGVAASKDLQSKFGLSVEQVQVSCSCRTSEQCHAASCADCIESCHLHW